MKPKRASRTAAARRSTVSSSDWRCATIESSSPDERTIDLVESDVEGPIELRLRVSGVSTFGIAPKEALGVKVVLVS